ncbi:uncharacterized protein BJX67DRAFT_349027 [Aspergillus lucknowensis]|uniref:Uncharacterized protein n=1 Tax=Aspergillus lucknowensis TaxID=176173 RepID=A0ABR4LVY3_9EURO
MLGPTGNCREWPRLSVDGIERDTYGILAKIEEGSSSIFTLGKRRRMPVILDELYRAIEEQRKGHCFSSEMSFPNQGLVVIQGYSKTTLEAGVSHAAGASYKLTYSPDDRSREICIGPSVSKFVKIQSYRATTASLAHGCYWAIMNFLVALSSQRESCCPNIDCPNPLVPM